MKLQASHRKTCVELDWTKPVKIQTSDSYSWHSAIGFNCTLGILLTCDERTYFTPTQSRLSIWRLKSINVQNILGLIEKNDIFAMCLAMVFIWFASELNATNYVDIFTFTRAHKQNSPFLTHTHTHTHTNTHKHTHILTHTFSISFFLPPLYFRHYRRHLQHLSTAIWSWHVSFHR
jgi:hypothetical protein